MLRPLLVPALVLPALLISVACKRDPIPVRSYQLGERVKVGRFVYSAFETQWLAQIGEGPEARVPQQRFFLVRMAVTNSGGDAAAAPNLSVVDDNGTAYEELSNGDGVPQWIGFLRMVGPSDTAQGNLVFDVPPRHYRLRVSDEGGQNTATIDLPLDFATPQAPDITLPQDQKQ